MNRKTRNTTRVTNMKRGQFVMKTENSRTDCSGASPSIYQSVRSTLGKAFWWRWDSSHQNIWKKTKTNIQHFSSYSRMFCPTWGWVNTWHCWWRELSCPCPYTTKYNIRRLKTIIWRRLIFGHKVSEERVYDNFGNIDYTSAKVSISQNAQEYLSKRY
jgi:hypothetical protein